MHITIKHSTFFPCAFGHPPHFPRQYGRATIWGKTGATSCFPWGIGCKAISLKCTKFLWGGLDGLEAGRMFPWICWELEVTVWRYIVIYLWLKESGFVTQCWTCELFTQCENHVAALNESSDRFLNFDQGPGGESTSHVCIQWWSRLEGLNDLYYIFQVILPCLPFILNHDLSGSHLLDAACYLQV